MRLAMVNKLSQDELDALRATEEFKKSANRLNENFPYDSAKTIRSLDEWEKLNHLAKVKKFVEKNGGVTNDD